MFEIQENLTPGLPEKAYLVVNAQVFHLDKNVIRIGRNFGNDLVLNDPAISRYHAEIRYEDSQFILNDLNSSGGTFLNNKKIKQNVLFSGDIILFTKIPVMFMSEGASLRDQASQGTGELGSELKSNSTPDEKVGSD